MKTSRAIQFVAAVVLVSIGCGVLLSGAPAGIAHDFLLFALSCSFASFRDASSCAASGALDYRRGFCGSGRVDRSRQSFRSEVCRRGFHPSAGGHRRVLGSDDGSAVLALAEREEID
jgi:hypothetical protein